MKKDYFILVIIIIAGIFSLFMIGVINLYPVQVVSSPVDAENLSWAIEVAEQRVLDSYQYREYNGSSLVLIGQEINECDRCWIITYKYRVDEEKAPLNIKYIEMSFTFEDGRIVHTNYSEILDKKKKIYCMPEERDGDFCIEVYDPVCGYFSLDCNDNFCREEYSNSCFACKDENVLYYEKESCLS